jgi:hypothetical protein
MQLTQRGEKKMQGLENSQVAELLRQQNALLKEIKALQEPLSFERLNVAEKAQAFEAKIKSVSLAECFETSAEMRGLTLDDFNREFLSPPKRRQERTFAEIAGVSS